MKDTDLYSQILGLTKPWFVDAAELNTEGRVDIHRSARPSHRSGRLPLGAPLARMVSVRLKISSGRHSRLVA